MVRLNVLTGAILRDILRAEAAVNSYAKEIESYYEKDPLLAESARPRINISEVDIELKVAVKKLSPDKKQSRDESSSRGFFPAVREKVRGLFGGGSKSKHIDQAAAEHGAFLSKVRVKQILTDYATNDEAIISVINSSPEIPEPLKKEIIDSSERRTRDLRTALGAAEEKTPAYRVEVEVLSDKLKSYKSDAISTIRLRTRLRSENNSIHPENTEEESVSNTPEES